MLLALVNAVLVLRRRRTINAFAVNEVVLRGYD